jgi:prepilin peptidase CpaA
MTHVHQIALLVAATACVIDVRTRRIPNVLTFGAAIAGAVTQTWLGGIDGLGVSVLGWLTGASLFFPLFALRGMGAGDVKLLAAIGTWLGPMPTVMVAFYSTLAGGVMALAVAVRAGYLRQAIRNMSFMASFWLTVGFKPVEGLTLEQARTPRLAYAAPMLAGLLVTLWLQ